MRALFLGAVLMTGLSAPAAAEQFEVLQLDLQPMI
jgi:hypothetical protein